MEVRWDRHWNGHGQGHRPRFPKFDAFQFWLLDGAVEFFAFDSSSDSSNGLFRSDGTATGTFELATNVGTSTPLPVTASPDGDFKGDSCGRTRAAKPRSGT
jgi:hypothetical protein